MLSYCAQEMRLVGVLFLVTIIHIINIPYEHRKLQRREERARSKKNKLVRIPNRSISSETSKEVSTRIQTYRHECIVRNKVETILVTAFTHQFIEEAKRKNGSTNSSSQ